MKCPNTHLESSPDIYRAEPEGGGFAEETALAAPINTPGTEPHVAFGPDGKAVKVIKT